MPDAATSVERSEDRAQHGESLLNVVAATGNAFFSCCKKKGCHNLDAIVTVGTLELREQTVTTF